MRFSPLFAVALLMACSEPPVVPRPDSFKVTFVGQPDLGSLKSPKPFIVDKTAPDKYTVNIEAMDRGQPATDFNGWVVLTVRPICPRFEDLFQKFVKLDSGKAQNVEMEVALVSGAVHIIAREVGYVQSANLDTAACNNGVDDDGDGFIDMDDRGCFYPSDDTEEGGTGGTGASPPIQYANPTMAQVQEPVASGDASPLDTCQMAVDTGWMLITRITNDGLYLTDYSKATWDPAGNKWIVTGDDVAYAAMFAYNYSQPINLQEGDCLISIDGQVDEFFGFTELGKPTWRKGDFGFCGVKGYLAGLTDVCPSKETAGECCDQACVADLQRQGRGEADVTASCCQESKCPADYACIDYKCRPDPEAPKHRTCRQRIEGLANTPADITTLMIDLDGTDYSVWDKSRLYRLAERFESGLVQLSNVNVFTEARHCDADGDHQINFADNQEKQCANDCGDKIDCVVWETYNRYNQWTVNFKDGVGVDQEVNMVSAGAIQDFDPLKLPGSGTKTLDKVIGNLRHLTFGRPPWILNVRGPDDCPQCKN